MPAPDQTARAKTWRKVAVGLAAIILFGVLALTSVFFWSGYQVDREIARLEQRFGNLGEAALTVEAVPPDDNRAQLVRDAAALVDKDQYHAVQMALLPYFDRESPEPAPAEVHAFLKTHQPAISVAAQFGARTRSNFEVDYANDGELPDLYGARIVSSALYLDASVQLDAGRANEAAKRVSSALALAASFKQEPSLLMQLIRIAAGIQACESVEGLITRGEPSKERLAEIARWLAENRDPDPMRLGLLSELRYFVKLLRRIDSGAHSASDAYRGAFRGWTQGPMRLLGRPIYRLAFIQYVKQAEQLLDLQAGPRPRPAFEPPPPAQRWNLPGRLADDFSAGWARSIETGDQFIGALGVSELGVALRRYRLDHGTYPNELAALVPAYVARVPIDPFTGRAPVYARHDAGFTLKGESAQGYNLKRSPLVWSVSK